MEFERLHISPHPHALGQNIRDIEYSASAVSWKRSHDVAIADGESCRSTRYFGLDSETMLDATGRLL